MEWNATDDKGVRGKMKCKKNRVPALVFIRKMTKNQKRKTAGKPLFNYLNFEI